MKRLLGVLAVLSGLCLLYYYVWFMRLPERNIPQNNQLFVSPANGKVVAVAPWNRESVIITKKKFGAFETWTQDVDTAGTLISIQMNVTNVHFQRSPVDAKVIKENYVKGSFNNAVQMNNEYGTRFENEHNEILLETTDGKRFKVIQIAGFVARRIEDFVKPGQTLRQGEVFGVIKLGSQVSIVLPHGVKVKARVGDVVTEGESVLAEF